MIVEREVQEWNVSSSITLRDGGSVMVEREVQFLKALCWIVLMDGGNVAVERATQSKKQRSLIHVKFDAMTTSVTCRGTSSTSLL